jgi:drug/metabolite transporter (DMT)-like permease
VNNERKPTEPAAGEQPVQQPALVPDSYGLAMPGEPSSRATAAAPNDGRAIGSSVVSGGPSSAIRQRATPPLTAAAPWLFVLLWSTGFIGAKYGLPSAGPFTFLTLRLHIAWILLAGIALVRRARWPRRRREIGHIVVAGLLLHAGYLGGVFFAIAHGLPAGLASLIVGLQPILTAVGAQGLLREQIAPRQWLGLLLGFVGVTLVVGEQARAAADGSIGAAALGAIAVALLATTVATLYQKRFGGEGDLTAAAAIQYAAAGAALTPLAVAEGLHIDWSLPFILALAWLVLALSLGAVLLLLALIRQHAVSRVTGLLYLVPPATAIEAYVLFGERLSAGALIGMVVVVTGVALVIRRPENGPAFSVEGDVPAPGARR